MGNRRNIFFFFFSSRRRHTRSLRDWSSDVCSSDLCLRRGGDILPREARTELILAGRVPQHRREVAHDERDVVTELLEDSHLPQDDRVPDVEVGSGRIEAGLDLEGDAARPRLVEALLQLLETE